MATNLQKISRITQRMSDLQYDIDENQTLLTDLEKETGSIELDYLTVSTDHNAYTLYVNEEMQCEELKTAFQLLQTAAIKQSKIQVKAELDDQKAELKTLTTEYRKLVNKS